MNLPGELIIEWATTLMQEAHQADRARRESGHICQTLQSRLRLPSEPSVQSVSSAVSETSMAEQSEPVAERPADWAPGAEWQDGDWTCRVCGNHNWRHRGFCNGGGGRCKASRDEDFGPGDWYCKCGNWNLSRRTECNRWRCKAPRSEGGQCPP